MTEDTPTLGPDPAGGNPPVGAVPPFAELGAAFLDDAVSGAHREVAVRVTTLYGALIGSVSPATARAFGESLIRHADACTELDVATPGDLAAIEAFANNREGRRRRRRGR